MDKLHYGRYGTVIAYSCWLLRFHLQNTLFFLKTLTSVSGRISTQLSCKPEYPIVITGCTHLQLSFIHRWQDQRSVLPFVLASIRDRHIGPGDIAVCGKQINEFSGQRMPSATVLARRVLYSLFSIGSLGALWLVGWRQEILCNSFRRSLRVAWHFVPVLAFPRQYSAMT